MSEPIIIFYDLVPSSSSRLFYSPNTMKTRLSLAHKGVPFETKAVTYNDTRTWLKDKTGFERVFCPLIELPDGTFLMDSWKIAEWLDETYPDAPSLFEPDLSTPIDPASPSRTLAKNFAWMFSEGFGSSDSQWSTFVELAAEPLRKLMEPEVAEYFSSDAKNGTGAWDALRAKDQNEMLQHAKSSLLPLDSTLSRTHYLAGNNPGYVDYVAYGRYIMMRSVVPELAKEVWENDSVPRVRDWLRRLEQKFAVELKEVLDEMQ
ncbi:glutathione S-transferase family protein [Sporobolomyces salmoneus]|uniref:glutathione S-transferase family protein n=1 Tax=Sporobolomyces salmoneus TaxID=183962 RepID=UPI003170B300